MAAAQLSSLWCSGDITAEHVARWCVPSAVLTRPRSDTDSLRHLGSVTLASRESRKVGFIDVYIKFFLRVSGTLSSSKCKDVCLTYAKIRSKLNYDIK